MRRASWLAIAASCMAVYGAAAQDGSIAPLPSGSGAAAQRITPEGDDASAGMYTTHKQPVPLNGTMPWTKASPAAPPPAQAIAPLNTPPASYAGTKSPFGRGSAGSGPSIPSAPHTATAVPVPNVDAVEAREAQPPTPVAEVADPAKEDPAQPTELTSPIFDASSDKGGARTMALRVLNKVTGQSALLEARPGDRLKFGQIEIQALMCRSSIPTSQSDYAGLLDIQERLPGSGQMKPLFRGWMYASSPSITALEHPVYDVTMVNCTIATAAAPAEEPEEKPGKKPSRKSSRRS